MDLLGKVIKFLWFIAKGSILILGITMFGIGAAQVIEKLFS